MEISAPVLPRSPTSSPEAEGVSERFFRNLYSYLDDCYVQGASPSLFQLLIFLDSAETSLAFPGPGWLVRPASWLAAGRRSGKVDRWLHSGIPGQL